MKKLLLDEYTRNMAVDFIESKLKEFEIFFSKVSQR